MMDDLISRAEAIKEIEPIRYCGDFISALIHLPAIDAIPVEWLCKKVREEGERENILHAEYIKDLIWEWHNEQEAQDG